jgi:aminopeptidase N
VRQNPCSILFHSKPGMESSVPKLDSDPCGDGRIVINIEKPQTEFIMAMWNRFLVIFLLLLPNAAYAFEQTDKGLLDYTLEVFFDIQASRITGVAKIPVKRDQELKVHKGRLHLIEVILNGQKIDVSASDEVARILPSEEGMIEIRYEGIFGGSEHPEGTSSVIGPQGIFLTGTWYPHPVQMCYYHLTVTLPQGYEAVSEADTIEKASKDGRTNFSFHFPHPLDSIHLIATQRYKIVKDQFDGVEIFAYFFPEDIDLIETYMEDTKHYLKLYDALISKYPYKRFSIVENFLPTGYSMPTYTLLGQVVMRLPFIPETSLGHEILHQWFGNSVYIDYREGNWAEGLTTYLADHLYEEEKGRGAEYRKGALIDYMSYVNDKNEFPLRDFVERTDEASEAIGYGKALMVFQMLKKLVGEERFYESIRYFATEMRFKKASWKDIQRAFEKYGQRDLSWFFNQWIDEKGLAEFSLEEVEGKPSGDEFEVAFTVAQKRKVFILDPPAAVSSDIGKTTQVFHLQREKERFEMIVDDLPQKIVLDEGYDVARRLSKSEFPPVIARLVGDEERIVVLPPQEPELYEEVINAFKEKAERVTEPSRLTFEDLKTHSLVILGSDNPLIGRLYGSVVTQGGFSVVIKENPWNHWKVAGVLDARSKEEVNAAFPKIFHYGKYSVLSFDHGINVYKKIDESGSGIIKSIFQEAVAIEISDLMNLPGVLDRVADKKIVYVGETHDQFPHHVMELEIIKNLHRRGRRIAIGMEMFQRPFQKIVDEYIEGKIDERDFLKRTEYFKRWGFDYHFYRPILLFARSERIPVVALNMRQEIVDKVFRNGLNSLSEEEKKSLPSQMDFSDEAYKERLKKIFREHEDFETRTFDFFYEAQILWDETMAESIDRFLKGQPNDQMVVLTGSGHLAYGSGIPKRASRRNGYDYTIILNDADLKKDIANYVLFPGILPAPTSPKLMVFLKEETGKVEITGFPHDSASEKAGLQVGDVILSIDRTPVHSVDDIKIELLFKKRGEKVSIVVLRKGLLGAEEKDFEVVLK